jgi:hypothetical protein
MSTDVSQVGVALSPFFLTFFYHNPILVTYTSIISDILYS